MPVRSGRRQPTSTRRPVPGSWRRSARAPRRPTTTRPRPRRSRTAREALPAGRPAAGRGGGGRAARRRPAPARRRSRGASRAASRGAPGDHGAARTARSVRRSRRRPRPGHGCSPALSAAYMLDRRLDEAMSYGTRGATAGRGCRRPRHRARCGGDARRRASSSRAGWTRAGRMLEAAIAAPAPTTSRPRRPAPTGCSGRRVRARGVPASANAGSARASRRPSGVELWNHRHYMAAHLAHVAVGDRSLGRGRRGRPPRARRRPGRRSRRGSPRCTVLGYVALGRGRARRRAARPSSEAREPGLADGRAAAPVARAVGSGRGGAGARRPERRPSRACRRGLGSASAPGRRRGLPLPVPRDRHPSAPRARRSAAARRWLEAVAAADPARAIPGTLAGARPRRRPAGAGRRRDRPGPDGAGRPPSAGWARARRVWEGTWASLDLARAHLRVQPAGRCRPDWRPTARTVAAGLGAGDPAAAAEMSARRPVAALDPEPWAPLTAREFEVARLIADGRTNVEIAEELGDHPQDRGLARGAHPGQARGRAPGGDRGAGPRLEPARATLPAFTAMTEKSSVGTARSERGMVRAARYRST